MTHGQRCSAKPENSRDVIPTAQSTSVHLTRQLLGFDTSTEHCRAEGQRWRWWFLLFGGLKRLTLNPLFLGRIAQKRYKWEMIGVTNATGTGNDYLQAPAERVNGLWGSAWVAGNDWSFCICTSQTRQHKILILKASLEDALCVCVCVCVCSCETCTKQHLTVKNSARLRLWFKNTYWMMCNCVRVCK